MRYTVLYTAIACILFSVLLSHPPTSSAYIPEEDPGRTRSKPIEKKVGEKSSSIIRTILSILKPNSGVSNPGPSPLPGSATATPSPAVQITPNPQSSAPLRQALQNITNPEPPSPQTIASIRACLTNRTTYMQVAGQTGVAWEIVAGIHYVEGGCVANKSCVSGRVIGTNEPDVHGNCSSSNSGLGRPNPLPGGGCGFTDLLDSCIYGAEHLKGKIGGVPHTLADFAKALGRYNGTGNANCGRTPYGYCPPSFEGDDHIHPMSKLDAKHNRMYLVYCADYTMCNPPVIFNRTGVITVANILIKQLGQ